MFIFINVITYLSLISPRSLQACKRTGIEPKELFYYDLNSFKRFNPEVDHLDPDIQKMRFERAELLRQQSIQIVKNVRKLI